MSRIDETHNPSRTSWVPGSDSHADFPIQNLPFGIFAAPGEVARAGVAIGDWILDLSGIGTWLPDGAARALGGPTLNQLFALPAADRAALRRCVSTLLSEEARRSVVEPHLYRADNCTMSLPCVIGDYTDFYVGIHHANNVGRQFRPDNPLLPNYKWVPIGYHGRASSIRPSDQPVIRPTGQWKAPDASTPTFGPTRKLDYEVELGIWIGSGNALGTPLQLPEAREQAIGLCLLNDWSARDIQAWEYQPLGPFLSKNFHSTVSPWVITIEALAPFRISQPARQVGDPAPLPYLWDNIDQESGAFAITLGAYLSSAIMRKADIPPLQLSRGPASNMYWTIAQLIAHHTSNGCDLRPGDLLGTGTISSADDAGLGSMLEMTRGGSQPLSLPSGEERTFLEDGDEIMLTAQAKASGYRSIGFGRCSAIVLPARG